ncbi:MAG: Amino acid transporter, partial [Daejeonella sp.]|nr:Amino acid transporter [Daejeonella sp.]
ILRKTDPNRLRPFKTPLMPFVPILGAVTCVLMMIGLGRHNWERLIIWMAIGFVIYFTYSIRHSKIRNEGKTVFPKDPPNPTIVE